MILGDVALTRRLSSFDIVEHSLRRRDEANLRLPSLWTLYSKRPINGLAAESAEYAWDSLALHAKIFYKKSPGVGCDVWHLAVNQAQPLHAHRSPVAAAGLLLQACLRSDRSLTHLRLSDTSEEAAQLWRDLKLYDDFSRGQEIITRQGLQNATKNMAEELATLPNYHTHLTDSRG